MIRKPWIIAIATSIYCLVAFSAHAQQPCYSTFSVNQWDGCAPLSLVITSHVSNENPLYFYGDDSTPSNSPTHTYSEPGAYELIRIITPSCASTVTDTMTIRVYDSTPPAFEVDSCLNSASISLTDTIYPWHQVWVDPPSEPAYRVGIFESGTTVPLSEPSPSYQVEVRGTISDQETSCASSTRTVTPRTVLPQPQALSLFWEGEDLLMVFDKDETLGHILFESVSQGEFQVFDNSPEGDTIRLSGRDKSQQYCYRLGVVSDCIELSSITDTAQIGQEYLSSPLCHTPLAIEAQEGAIRLSWISDPFISITSFQILRDGEPLSTIADNSAQTYSDSAVVCGRSYCYQLETRLSNGTVVRSPEVCAQVSAGKALRATQLRAGWERDSLWVRWEVDRELAEQVTLYGLSGALSGGVPISEKAYLDTLADFTLDSVGCYYLQVDDVCGNTSISDTTCSMHLEAQGIVEGNELDWTPFEGLEGKFEYQVEARVGEAWARLGQLDFTTTRYVHVEEEITQRKNTYRIVAQSLEGDSLRAYSNTVELEEQVRARVPDAFTPNNDGLNEAFNFERIRVASGAAMKIYNRLGILVYEGTDQDEGWDGRIQERPAPSGAYVYVIEGQDKFGEPFLQKGTFLLLRP